MRLLAEREGEEQFCAEVATMEEGEAVVERLESAGKWPEGFDAILVDNNGKRWMMTDRWEPLS